MARRYKKNRVSRKGKTPYQIYLDKRAKLEAEGYALRDVTDEETFMQRYNYARSIGDTNFMRDYPRYDRYVNRENFINVRTTAFLVSEESEEGKEFYDKYGKITWKEIKKWDNVAWTNFRDEALAVGYSYKDFRGIYA